MNNKIKLVSLGILIVITGISVIIMQTQNNDIQDYGTTTLLHGNVTNPDMQSAFWEAYQNEKSAQWTKVVYTYEGDPIIYNIQYQNQPFFLKVTIDTRQDQFGSKYIKTIECKDMIIDGEIQLTGCTDMPNGMIVIP